MADGKITIGTKIDQIGAEKGIKDLEKRLNGTVKKAGKVGKNLSMYLTAPILALGGAAFVAANDMDKAYKNIRAGTGATGDALEGLKDSFKTVFANVPESADEVSNALADINTRTGATGGRLEELTKQFLDLGRVAGEDTSELIAKGSRAFGDWNIETEKQAESLDYFWKVSQTTGIGVGQLMDKVVQFGAPMRQLGFDFESTAALLGKWEKEGVNTEIVMSGMRQGLSRMAQAGKEPQKEFPKLIKQIQEAGNAGDANALAIEAFGARAGPDMAAAIREGRFGVEELLNTLDSSGETIEKAGEDTLTLGEKFAQIKNQAQIGLEPLGRMLLDVAEKYLPSIIEGLTGFVQWLTNLSPVVWVVIAAIGGFLALLGPLLLALSSISLVMMGLNLATLGWTVAILAIVAVVAVVVVLIVMYWDQIKAFTIAVFTAIWNFMKIAWEGIKIAVIAVATAIWNGLKAIWNGIKAFTSATFTAIGNGLKAIWNGIKTAVIAVGNGIKSGLTSAWNGIKSVTSSVFNGIKNFFQSIFDKIGSAADKFASAFGKVWDSIKEGAQSIAAPIAGVLNAVMAGIEAVVNGIAGAINKLPSFDVPSWVPGIGGSKFGLPDIPTVSLPRVPSLDVGTNFVAQDGLAMIHKGEAVVPKEYNPAAGGTGGGLHLEVVYNVDGEEIYRVIEPHMDVSLQDKITFEAYMKGEK